MNSKSLIEQSKYEEYLQSVELEQVTRPNLFKHQDYQPETISVNKIKLSKQDYCRVLFIPTRLYKNDLYEINFRGDQINLLNCMYKYGIQGEISYISLLDISNKPETLISYEFKIQDAQSKINFKAGVLGGKYILLSLQSATEVELHILNLDLTLIMKHNFKDSFYIKDQEYIFDNHMPEEDLGEFENSIDYFQDKIIYYQCQQVLFKIDINQRFVEQKIFQQQSCLLLRLLPITQSEFNYYFKSSDKNSLSGYSKNEQNKLILFVVLETKIFQLNIFNLAIIRETKNPYIVSSKKQKKIIQAFVLPIQLKSRQNKLFSSWTFIIKAKDSNMNLVDWREKDLFQNQMSTDDNSDQSGIKSFMKCCIIHKILVNKKEILIQLRDSNRYIQYTSTFNMVISKIKGKKNYDYSFNFIYQDFNQISQYYKVLHYYPPILLKNSIVYPCLTIKNEYRQIISYDLNFLWFNRQGSYYLEKLQNCNDQISQTPNLEYSIIRRTNQSIVFQLIDQKIKKTISYLYPVRCNGKLGKSFDKRIKNYLYNDNKSEIIFIEDDQDYGGPSYYNLCSILPKEQDDGLYNKVLELKTYIMSYSKFEKDSYNNLYLPMTYKEDEQLYFGIYDVNSKQFINEKILILNDPDLRLSYLNEEKKEFILLFKYYYEDLDEYLYNLYILQLDQKENKLKLIKDNIIEYSQVEKDNQNNIFLPMLFYEDKKKYFGIFDLNKKQIIKESTRLSQYTHTIHSNYYEDKKEFILLFEIFGKNSFLAFYSFDMIQLKFKFINMHKIQNIYFTLSTNKNKLILKSSDKNRQIIIFDRNKRFEIRKICQPKIYFKQAKQDLGTQSRYHQIMIIHNQKFNYKQFFNTRSQEFYNYYLNELQVGWDLHYYIKTQLNDGKILIYKDRQFYLLNKCAQINK